MSESGRHLANSEIVERRRGKRPRSAFIPTSIVGVVTTWMNFHANPLFGLCEWMPNHSRKILVIRSFSPVQA
jgi:hypothetical protein